MNKKVECADREFRRSIESRFEINELKYKRVLEAAELILDIASDTDEAAQVMLLETEGRCGLVFCTSVFALYEDRHSDFMRVLELADSFEASRSVMREVLLGGLLFSGVIF
ncbi:MAG: hypothetical protein Q4C01_01210 [Clostridia bacterium]|nr:hypothetical protein [Clostridia bacterium]